MSKKIESRLALLWVAVLCAGVLSLAGCTRPQNSFNTASAPEGKEQVAPVSAARVPVSNAQSARPHLA